ncbi:hypothetical protein LIA77_04058 [Sarocladium implicatum]|nr:hypothetical protein LIA77_04058 [Sarocladium implicatum]
MRHVSRLKPWRDGVGRVHSRDYWDRDNPARAGTVRATCVGSSGPAADSSNEHCDWRVVFKAGKSPAAAAPGSAGGKFVACKFLVSQRATRGELQDREKRRASLDTTTLQHLRSRFDSGGGGAESLHTTSSEVQDVVVCVWGVANQPPPPCWKRWCFASCSSNGCRKGKAWGWFARHFELKRGQNRISRYMSDVCLRLWHKAKST